MWFFDIFKKKSTHEEKLYIAYDSLKKNSKETFFPDGIEQANNIILSISIILNKNLSDLTSKDYYNFLSMYFV